MDFTFPPPVSHVESEEHSLRINFLIYFKHTWTGWATANVVFLKNFFFFFMAQLRMKWMNLQSYLLLTLGTKITCRMAWVRMTAMTVNTHRPEDYQKSSQPSSSKEIYPVMFAFFPLLLENNESFYENSSDISPICLKISEILPENSARLSTG